MANENRLLTSVHTATRLLSSTVVLDEALRRTLEAAVQAVDASGGSILLHDAEAHQLWFHHVIGAESQSAGFGLYGVAIRDDEGIAGQVFQTQQPQIENNAQANPQHARRIDTDFQYETRNLITVPIRYPGSPPIGIMQLVNKRDGDFTDEDLIVLDIIASISAMSAHTTEMTAQAKKSATLDYLGRVVYDITNRVSRLLGPTDTLVTLQADALERLAGKNPPADVIALCDDLTDRLQTLAEGIQDIQRYTRFMGDVATGQPLVLRLEPNDLIQAIERQLDQLDETAESENGIKITRDYGGRDSLVFPFDSFLMQRALFNLVTNALDATPSGGSVTVQVAEEDDQAVISIKDTGAGMPGYTLNRILSGAASRQDGHIGLRSLIVKEIIEQHHGTFEGESAEGTGTEFRIRLPLHPTSEESEEPV